MFRKRFGSVLFYRGCRTGDFVVGAAFFYRVERLRFGANHWDGATVFFVAVVVSVASWTGEAADLSTIEEFLVRC